MIEFISIIACIFNFMVFDIDENFNSEPIEELPILMYHEVDTPTGPWKNLYVTEENFASQMDLLLDNGYTSIDFYDLDLNQRGLLKLPDKPIIITFDDGYKNMYKKVFPILKERNMKATFFIYPQKFNTPSGLSDSEIKEMVEGNMEMGSHSLTHADLTKISESQLDKEILDSKKIIEKITGKQIISFCYPAGRYNQDVTSKVAKGNYKYAVTTKYGQAYLNSGKYTLSRIRINYSDTLRSFGKKIGVK